MINHYLLQLKSYIAKDLPQLGAQYMSPSETISITPQINKQLILELLLQEYLKKTIRHT